MKTEQITPAQAATISQTKTYGIISEGCTGVWGEGDTVEEAIADAEQNQLEYAGAVDLDGCWITEVSE